MEYLDAVEEDDSSSVCSSENFPVSVDSQVEDSHNSDDADDEQSQTSSSPGVTVTPDLNSGPFKFPNSVPRQRKDDMVSESMALESTNNANDDGFFSGFDVDECLNEDMDILWMFFTNC